MKRIVALALLSSGCGLGYRMAAGPTVDLDGHVGAEVRVSAAMYVGPRRRVALVLDAGGGVTQSDSFDGAERVVVGADWAVLPTSGFGYRVGARAGWLHTDADEALVVGPDFALLHALGPLGKATMTLGLDARCDQRFGAAVDEDCALAVDFEITNLQQDSGGPYY